MARSIVLTGLLLGSAASIAGCGLMLDYSDYTDGPAVTGGGGSGTGTTTGGGGTATGNPTGGGGSGATGGSGTENCTNQIDDDGDNLIDCADESCIAAGYTCAPVPVGGWTDQWKGPIVGFPPDITDPTCSGGFPNPADLPASWWLEVPPSQCACQCDVPRAVSCAGAQLGLRVQAFPDATCQTTPCLDPPSVTTVLPDTCTPSPSGATGSCTSAGVSAWDIFVSALPTSSANCTPHAGPQPDEPVWRDANNRGCESPVGAGCSEDSRCVGTVPAEADLCIWRLWPGPGDPCPAPYANETRLYEPNATVADTRTCTPTTVGSCQCQPIASVTCTGVFETWNKGNCLLQSDHSAPVPPQQQGECFPQTTLSMKYTPDGVNGWVNPNGPTTCTPSGTAQMLGDVTVVGQPAVQLCCRPGG